MEKLSDLGFAAMDVSMADENGAAMGSAGRDLIFVGDDGVYNIANYTSSAANSKMAGDIVAVEGQLPTLSFGTAVDTGLDHDGTGSGPALTALISAADGVIDATNNAVRMSSTNTSDSSVTHYIAVDVDGSETFTADDLLISGGSAIHLVSNPLDPETFTIAEFTV